MNHVLTDASLPPSGLSRPRTLLRYRLHVSNQGKTFAEVLREVLDRDFGGSNADFARAASIPISAVGRYLREQVPRPETIKKMAPHMGTTVQRLMAIAYPHQSESETDLGGPALHPLAVQLNLLLSEGSSMSTAERSNLEQVVGSVLAPYRKHLQRRKAG